MEELTKITLVVVGAIIGSIVGLAFWGVFGAFMGFVLTLLVIKLFNIWVKYRDGY